MRNRFVNAFVLVIGLTVTAAAASAQVTTKRLYEFGIDGGLEFGLNKPSTTSIGIPAQSLRMGMFMNEKWSLEPSIGLQSNSGGGERVTTYTARVGALYHLSKAPARLGVGYYVRPFVGFQGASVKGAGSDTRALLGAGYGLKHAFTDRVAGRVEANYSYLFAAGGDDGANQLGLTFGLSFFTR